MWPVEVGLPLLLFHQMALQSPELIPLLKKPNTPPPPRPATCNTHTHTRPIYSQTPPPFHPLVLSQTHTHAHARAHACPQTLRNRWRFGGSAVSPSLFVLVHSQLAHGPASTLGCHHGARSVATGTHHLRPHASLVGSLFRFTRAVND